MGLFNNNDKNIKNNKNGDKGRTQKQVLQSRTSEAQKINIFASIDENIRFLKNFFGDGIDLIQCKYEILHGNVQVGLAYIESITDKEMVMGHVITPLLNIKDKWDRSPDNLLLFLQARIISASDVVIVSRMYQIIERILNGYTIIFIENSSSALAVGSGKLEKRPVGKPENEETVLSSQESFTDDLKTNMSLIIKRVPIPDFRVESYTAGTLSHTKIRLIWLEGIANPKIIEEARNRIRKINIDSVDGIGVLAELIEDSPTSIFPKYRQSERPDVVVRNLANGRFAIICSNSPFAFIAPGMFWDNFKTMDDYEERATSSSYLRAVRYIAFFLSVMVSPLYLSFVTYNHPIVPPTLALNIAAGRQGVPFPSVIEMLVMTFGMSLIREAGLRMPGSVGYFIGTLAAVIIGQAIVSAGYVSASLIIVIAISAISAFAISSTTLVYTSRLLNYFFIFLAGFLGMFGLINGIVFLIWHLVSLRSFGVPYLYPLIPFDAEGMKDTFVRFPFSSLKKRLRILAPFNRVRTGEKGIHEESGGRRGE